MSETAFTRDRQQLTGRISELSQRKSSKLDLSPALPGN